MSLSRCSPAAFITDNHPSFYSLCYEYWNTESIEKGTFWIIFNLNFCIFKKIILCHCNNPPCRLSLPNLKFLIIILTFYFFPCRSCRRMRCLWVMLIVAAQALSVVILIITLMMTTWSQRIFHHHRRQSFSCFSEVPQLINNIHHPVVRRSIKMNLHHQLGQQQQQPRQCQISINNSRLWMQTSLTCLISRRILIIQSEWWWMRGKLVPITVNQLSLHIRCSIVRTHNSNNRKKIPFTSSIMSHQTICQIMTMFRRQNIQLMANTTQWSNVLLSHCSTLTFQLVKFSMPAHAI